MENKDLKKGMLVQAQDPNGMLTVKVISERGYFLTSFTGEVVESINKPIKVGEVSNKFLTKFFNEVDTINLKPLHFLYDDESGNYIVEVENGVYAICKSSQTSKKYIVAHISNQGERTQLGISRDFSQLKILAKQHYNQNTKQYENN